MPPQTHRGIDYPNKSVRWILTPFGIAGTWEFSCEIPYRGNSYSSNVTFNAVGKLYLFDKKETVDESSVNLAGFLRDIESRYRNAISN